MGALMTSVYFFVDTKVIFWLMVQLSVYKFGKY